MPTSARQQMIDFINGAIINRPVVKPYELAEIWAKRQQITAGRSMTAPTLSLLKIRLLTY